MVGAVQFGVLVACVVLFVPMGMAGWHLSRNKMLFFSGALFITLAVGVHLTPYIPSVSQFLSSISSPPVVVENRDFCLSLLNSVVWVDEVGFRGIPNSSKRSWHWAQSHSSLSCGFQRLGQRDASDLLNGSWIVVAGDSQARLFVLNLLNLVLESAEIGAVERELFKRHSDYRMVDERHGMKLDFIWAPYESNLTDMLAGFSLGRRYPDVLVMGTGLWHMLHVNNASDYGALLRSLKRSLTSLLPIMTEFGMDGPVTGSVSLQSPHMFWLGMPTLVNSMLNTEEKQEKMNKSMWEAYHRELIESKLLQQMGGPLVLLDIESLSGNCGLQCTIDGMHYDGVVYEASLHMMLNALLIISHQHM
uniref:CAS1 domain-containing protein 1 n=1 Tax=Anthurium amnicola TaxID=1678845 RepID=A0A1D1YLH7_9ARAE